MNPVNPVRTALTDRRRSHSTEPGRHSQLNLRVSEQERAALKQAAAEAGLDMVALIRKRVLGRASSLRPAAPEQLVELRRCLTQMGQMSSALHGLYRIARLGEIPAREELAKACADHQAMMATLFAALGRTL